MDVVLGGNSSSAHSALNQAIADLETLRAKVEQINAEFKGMQTNLTAIKSLLGSLAGTSGNVTNNIVNNNQRIDNSVRTTTNNINNMGNTMADTAVRTKSGISSILKSFMGLYAVGKIFSFVKQSMITGMDTIESESLFETSLDNMADSARQWSEDLSEQLGLNAVELRKNVGILYTMTTSMGIADDTAYDVATNLVKLAEDMASYYNISTDEAFVKLRSGLTGETEPLKAIGILVDEQTAKQYAYASGIAKTGENLTQQQKVLARYSAIMAQTSIAQGDLARTMESPANQLRTLKTRFEEMKQAVGAEFQPLLKMVFPALSQMIQAVTPHILSAVKGITAISKSIAAMNPMAVKAAAISLTALTVLANLNKIYAVYNALKKTSMILAFGETAANTMDVAATRNSAIVHGLLTKVYKILIPEVVNFSSVLKASLGWIGIIAGAVALLYSVFWKKKKAIDDTSSSVENLGSKFGDITNYKLNLDDTKKSFEDTSDAVDDTSDSIQDLKKQVSLAGFDEINTLSFDTEGENLVNLDTDDVDDYSDALDDLGNQLNSMPDIDMPDLSEYDLGELFNFSGLENVKNKFLEFVEDTFGTKARNKIDDFFYTLALIPDATSQMFDDMMNDGGIFNPDSKFWENWHTGFEDIKSSLNSFGEWYEASFKSIFGSVGEWWISFWEDMGAEIFNFKEKWVEVFEGFGEDLFNFKEKWISFWEGVGANFAVSGSFSSVSGSGGTINGYASGGFPDYGELFIARENGVPEMVGTMGGSPAVANNTEIVEGISQGVYEAVTAAIQQNTSSGNQKTIIPVYLFKGSSELTRIVADASMQYNAMTGGY